MAPSRLTVNVSIAVLCVVWSSTWWTIRVGLRDLPPYTSAAARFLLAGAVMAVAARGLRRHEVAPPPPRWLWVTMGLCNFAASYGILYWSEATVPSGIAAVLWGVFPLLMAVAGHLWLGERVTARQATGFLVAFGGVASMFGGDLGGVRGDILPAASILLLSPLVAAVGTVLIKRHGSGHSSLLLNRNAMLLGGVILAAAALLLERQEPQRWTAAALGALAYLALAGTCLTFGLYFWLLRWAAASRLSLISYVTPCLAMLLAALVGDGDLDLPSVVGTVLIAFGIWLVVRASRSRAAGRSPHA